MERRQYRFSFSDIIKRKRKRRRRLRLISLYVWALNECQMSFLGTAYSPNNLHLHEFHNSTPNAPPEKNHKLHSCFRTNESKFMTPMYYSQPTAGIITIYYPHDDANVTKTCQVFCQIYTYFIFQTKIY